MTPMLWALQWDNKLAPCQHLSCISYWTNTNSIWVQKPSVWPSWSDMIDRHLWWNIRESNKLKPRKSSKVSSKIQSIDKVLSQAVWDARLILIHDVSVVHMQHTRKSKQRSISLFMEKITFALHSTKSGQSIICMQSANRLTFYMETKTSWIDLNGNLMESILKWCKSGQSKVR